MASSEVKPAILVYPTGVDTYYDKTDFGITIGGESHVIPSGSPYAFNLQHVPQLTAPTSSVIIPGFVETTGIIISPFQYFVQYSGNDAGQLTFSAFNAGSAVSVTYLTAGDLAVAEWLNSLQASVVNIETFIGSGNNLTGSFVATTGGSMTGALTMNAASILTSLSGSNTIGVPGTPFSAVYSDDIVANKLSSPNGLSFISLTGSITITGSNYVAIESDGDITLGSKSVSISAVESGINTFGEIIQSGNIIPIASSEFDLGSSGNHWKNIYADNIETNAFVHTTGDSMSGDLTINASLNTNSINNVNNNLFITSTTGVIISAGNVVDIGTSDVDSLIKLNGVLDISSTGVVISTSLQPFVPHVIDMGTALVPFRTIYADNIVGPGGSGTFVRTSGDTMTGDLTMAFGAAINTDIINTASPTGLLTINVGELATQASYNIRFNTGPSLTQKLEIGLTEISLSTDIIPTQSGVNDIGSPSLPLRGIYADNLHLGVLESGSLIQGATLGDPTLTGTITLGTSSSIVSAGSGTVNLGSPSNPIGTIYASNIVTAESTGNFISKFGDTMLGDLTIASNILASGSGVNNIGSLTNPFGTIYADNIVSTGASGQFVLKTGDSMSGPLVLDTIYSTGTLVMSGNQIYQSAEEVNIASTNGPVIINANTELQLLVNSVAQLAFNATGTESFNSIYPDQSGTHSLGTPALPWGAIYVDDIFFGTGNNAGPFVHITGDEMTGGLSIGPNIFDPSNISLIVGSGNSASGLYSFAQGQFSQAIGLGSHAEGSSNAQGDFSHSEGISIAIGQQAHAEGYGTLASGNQAHSEGYSTQAINANTHSQGFWTQAIGDTSHAEGAYTYAYSEFSHVQGYASIVSGSVAFAAGKNAYALNDYSTVICDDLGATSTAVSQMTLGFTNGVVLRSGTDIIPDGSGTSNLGSPSNPFDNIYVNNINVNDAVWNEIPGGVFDGSNPTFTLLNSPISPVNIQLYVNGLYQAPSGIGAPFFDFSISGPTITMVNPPAPGSIMIANYRF